MNENELRKILEERGYKIKTIRVYKNGHFKVVGEGLNYRFVAWEQYPLSSIKDASELTSFKPIKKEEE